MKVACTHCGRHARVTDGGKLEQHTNPSSGMPCHGSGQYPR